MTTLYLYFADLSELLSAALEPLELDVEALLERFDRRWPDETIEQECLAFLAAHHSFWTKHSRLLHLRNSLADAGDPRMLDRRRAMSQPVLACVRRQWDSNNAVGGSKPWNYAVVLLTMFERMATITTDETFIPALPSPQQGGRERFIDVTLQAEAHIIALTIRDGRRNRTDGTTC